jgi:hypothetical protein
LLKAQNLVAHDPSATETRAWPTKAPIEAKDFDATAEYPIRIRVENQPGGRRVALLVKHRQTSYRPRAA